MYRHIVSAALLALAASLAHADTSVREVRVQFADLNPDHPAGVAVLYQRIRSAARTVCENPSASRGALMVAPTQCVDAAINQALLALNRPALLAYACGRDGGPSACARTDPFAGTP